MAARRRVCSQKCPDLVFSFQPSAFSLRCFLLATSTQQSFSIACLFMHIPKCLYFGLAMLMAGAGLRAQTGLPAEIAAPLLAPNEVRPAPAELLLQQQAAQHALELGLPTVAAEIYRGLLAVPGGGDRAALT